MGRAAMQHVAINSGARTHPGRVRRLNEDAIVARDDLALWAVADGMGGETGGRWASATAVEALVRAAEDAADAGRRLDAGLEAGHAEIAAAAATLSVTMGSTVAALSFDGMSVTGRWVGDSRIYRWRDGRLHQISRDHSVVQDLVDRGAVAADDADRHPMAHLLSRAVGMGMGAAPGRFAEAACPGDRFLLCSDGLSRVLPAALIEARLGTLAPEPAADALLEDALAMGAPDNVSVVVVEVAATAH
ncbi:PP2C family protein-serine/threonine phosphatase [Sphingomonas jatrophae]|nr:PP2C family serine/threonine-protein phosphatase [Sphingomonas jatrophae]